MRKLKVETRPDNGAGSVLSAIDRALATAPPPPVELSELQTVLPEELRARADEVQAAADRALGRVARVHEIERLVKFGQLSLDTPPARPVARAVEPMRVHRDPLTGAEIPFAMPDIETGGRLVTEEEERDRRRMLPPAALQKIRAAREAAELARLDAENEANSLREIVATFRALTEGAGNTKARAESLENQVRNFASGEPDLATVFSQYAAHGSLWHALAPLATFDAARKYSPRLLEYAQRLASEAAESLSKFTAEHRALLVELGEIGE